MSVFDCTAACTAPGTSYGGRVGRAYPRYASESRHRDSSTSTAATTAQLPTFFQNPSASLGTGRFRGDDDGDEREAVLRPVLPEERRMSNLEMEWLDAEDHARCGCAGPPLGSMRTPGGFSLLLASCLDAAGVDLDDIVMEGEMRNVGRGGQMLYCVLARDGQCAQYVVREGRPTLQLAAQFHFPPCGSCRAVRGGGDGSFEILTHDGRRAGIFLPATPSAAAWVHSMSECDDEPL